jgi:hypothetical protein
MRTIRRLQGLFAGLLLAALAPAALAPAAEPPSPAAALKRVKAADYPSANTVLVLADQDVVFQEGGDFVNTVHTVRLVLTSEGLARAASMALDYTKDAEQMELVEARVLKADGSIVPIAAANVKDTEQAGDMNIYDPNGRSLRVTVDGLAVGDAVDVTYRLRRATPTRAGYFADSFYFQSTEPVLSTRYRVDGPAAKPLSAELYHADRAGKIVASRIASGDRIRYEWKAENAPQIIAEPSMNYSNEVAALVVSTDPSWESFSRWWWSVTEPQLEITPELQQKADALVAHAVTDEARIQALYEFVSADVRYRGLGVGPRTGYTPRKAQETYTSRWGVCRDVAILLTALLRAEGFDAYPVLTNMGDPVLPRIAYDAFNHAIVALRNPDGSFTFLDPTVKNSREWLPILEREQSVLVCSKKGEPLATTPPLPPSANRGEASADTTISADGSMRSTIHVTTNGYFDTILRTYSAYFSERRQHELIERLVHAALVDARVVSFKLTVPPAAAASLDLVIEVPGAAVATGDYRLLRTVVTSGAVGMVEYYLPALLGGAPTRKYSLDTEMTFAYDQTEIIHLPEGLAVAALPNDARTSNKVSSLSTHCAARDPRTVECRRSFELRSRYVDTHQYLELRGLTAQLAQIGRQPLVLSAAKGGK